MQKRLRKKEAETKVFVLNDYLFPQQYSFVSDSSPYKIAVTSRRAGKTVACAAHLLDTALSKDNVNCLYITLSRNNAKKLVWRELRRLNKEYKLGGKENQSELSIQFANGSFIYVSGAKDTSEIEKFRGLAIKLCYIDECQSFRPYLKDLIEDIIDPALMDHAGSLCLIGTPGPVPTGYFHKCATDTSTTWSRHYWTFRDNPHIITRHNKTHQELLDRTLKLRGVSVDDPSIQREWFGRWVLDDNALLLRYNEAINDFNEMQPVEYSYILGIDLGFKDADALAVIAWAESDPYTYLVEEVVATKQGLTELVNEINKLRSKYKISKMVIDEGGLGKKLAEELRRRHAIPVQAADKVRKMENIAFLNDALRTGRFKAKPTSRFAQDSFLVEIDREKTTPTKIVVKNSFHSDIIDAVLYAFKESPAFSYTPPIKKPTLGTKEWFSNEITEMEEAAIEYFTALEKAEKGWMDDY